MMRYKIVAQAFGSKFIPKTIRWLVGQGGRMLEALREHHPLALHSVSLSLASPEEVDANRLATLVEMNRQLQPSLVSEHLAWSWWQGVHAPDLLPVATQRLSVEPAASSNRHRSDGFGAFYRTGESIALCPFGP